MVIFFDYRSVRAYQLDPRTQNPMECPVSAKKPNMGLVQLKFDKAKFDEIQRILYKKSQPATQADVAELTERAGNSTVPSANKLG